MTVLEWIYNKAGKLKGFTVPHHEEKKAKAKKRTLKRGPKPKVDWATVDWTLGDREIAEAVGVTRQRVNQARQKLGKASARDQARERRLDAIDAMDTSNMTAQDVADALGVSVHRAYLLLRETGRTSQNGGYKRSPHPLKGRAQPEKWKYDWDSIEDWSKESNATIARKLGADQSYVCAYRQRKGLPKGPDGRSEANARRGYGVAQQRALNLIRERRVMTYAEFLEAGVPHGSLTPALRTLERDGVVRVLRGQKPYAVLLTEVTDVV